MAIPGDLFPRQSGSLDSDRFELRPNRRQLLKGMSVLFGGAAVGGLSFFQPGRAFADESTFPVVDTTYGKLRGINIGGIKTFRGVHYGASTAGKNRFMPPQRPEKWAGVRDAMSYGEISPQLPSSPESEYVQAIDWDAHTESGLGEDCLHLNVWTPGLDEKKRPVFFSIHGGGYTSGSGNNPGYNGDPLARFGDAVVVTVNHRLGVLGYLHLGDLDPKLAYSGVAGMMDLVAALEWVHENIAQFGGDPDRVMIFGQSGGGAKTSTLLGMPSAKGLFQRAAVQSGAALGQRDRQTAAQSTERFLKTAGLDLDTLRSMPWQDLVTAEGARGFGPIVDGEIIPRDSFTPTAPESSAAVPMIIGTTLEDSARREGGRDLDAAALDRWAQETFDDNARRVLGAYRGVYPNASPYQLQARMLTDRRGRRSATRMAERKAAQGKAPAYLYIWNWPSPAFDGTFGAVHGMDVSLSFHNARPLLQGANSADALKMADIMASVWLAFASTGDPNCGSIPQWPAYNAATRPTMLFDLECRVEEDPASELRLLWDEIVGT